MQLNYLQIQPTGFNTQQYGADNCDKIHIAHGMTKQQTRQLHIFSGRFNRGPHMVMGT